MSLNLMAIYLALQTCVWHCLLIAFEIERRYIRFETKAVWWVQIVNNCIGEFQA